MSPLNQKSKVPRVRGGDAIPPVMKHISQEKINLYARASGDFNPIHVDAEYARRSRFGQRVAHGMFTGGLISAVLGNRLPGPGSIYLSQQIEFLAPVYIGDTITAVVEVNGWRPEKRIITLKTDCYNQDEKQVITGKAVLMVPNEEIGE